MARKPKQGSGGKTFTPIKPGSTTTRKVKRGPNKGDVVKFTANSPNAREPGKPKPRKLVKNVGPAHTSKIPRAEKKGKK